ncbi:MAG: winged helix-turn-helix domain-containing protein [Methanobrevibacter sp.]|uniref:winged helix-turn-helix domain-containing protein n=1 Tax=Methanobrevibacter sp. TaxID=66852 RepID=UPI0026E084EE|nr:winged helix-turn-helix domain-containing protein [Methanobrevibacter sp.]MDO5848860.1 winged helix-turn-helix domain-containing protein [Methanobrevibacter sp.]
MNILETLLLGRRGGATSIKIIDVLLVTPCNISQIAKIININYSTAQYHVTLLLENNILKKDSDRYGALYAPTSYLTKNINIYNDIKKELEKRENIIREAGNYE